MPWADDSMLCARFGHACGLLRVACETLVSPPLDGALSHASHPLLERRRLAAPSRIQFVAGRMTLAVRQAASASLDAGTGQQSASGYHGWAYTTALARGPLLNGPSPITHHHHRCLVRRPLSGPVARRLRRLRPPFDAVVLRRWGRVAFSCGEG